MYTVLDAIVYAVVPGGDIRRKRNSWFRAAYEDASLIRIASVHSLCLSLCMLCVSISSIQS